LGAYYSYVESHEVYPLAVWPAYAQDRSDSSTHFFILLAAG
jgi:hypothetical protein